MLAGLSYWSKLFASLRLGFEIFGVEVQKIDNMRCEFEPCICFFWIWIEGIIFIKQVWVLWRYKHLGFQKVHPLSQRNKPHPSK
jgi:hypothetical protein